MKEPTVFENIELFERWDADYYQPLSQQYYDRAVPRMLDALNAGPGDLVLDAGCGPGVHSIRAAQRGCRVHALDLSAAVLEEAARRAEAAGVRDRIKFEQADLTNLRLPDESFDRVFSWGVVIHIPQLEAALGELVRILKPGGRLALYVTNGSACDHSALWLGRALTGRPQPPIEKLPLGRGCWYDTHGDRLWVWYLQIGALTRHLEGLGLRRVKRIAGEFTELQRRVNGLPRRMLQRFNNAWYSLRLPAGPCAANLIVLEKPVSTQSNDLPQRSGVAVQQGSAAGSQSSNNGGSLRLAYLTTQYPKVSHTFIRRELREIERRGHSVLRLAIRPAEATPVDPCDREEAARTVHCLSKPRRRLLLPVIRTVFTRPVGFLRALRTTLQAARTSDRSRFVHLAYLIEAAFLIDAIRRQGIQHLHVHFGSNSADVARLMRRMGGPQYSMTVHGTETFDAPGPRGLRDKVADASFVVAISHFCAAQVRRWARHEDVDKVHIVHCPVSAEFLAETEPVNERSNTLLCVARLSAEKSPLVLIEAFARAVRGGSDDRLVLAGDGELRPAIEARLAELSLTDRVEITGWISEAQVREHMKAARAVVLASCAEGLPVVLMEAMALGRPVISTYVAGIPELVINGETGWLVPTGDVERLAVAIREALDAPVDVLRTMGEKGRARVQEQHHLATEADKLERLFREYLSAPSPVTPRTRQAELAVC